jgi:hypothetical protein
MRRKKGGRHVKATARITLAKRRSGAGLRIVPFPAAVVPTGPRRGVVEERRW